jgi:hypothetical protein
MSSPVTYSLLIVMSIDSRLFAIPMNRHMQDWFVKLMLDLSSLQRAIL